MVIHVNDTGTADNDVHLLEYIDWGIPELSELVKDHRQTYYRANVKVVPNMSSAFEAAFEFCRHNRGYLVCHGFVIAAGLVPVHHAWAVDYEQQVATEVFNAEYAEEKYFGRAMTVEEYHKLMGSGDPDWAFALMHMRGAPQVKFEPLPELPSKGSSYNMAWTAPKKEQQIMVSPEDAAIAEEMAAAVVPAPVMRTVRGASFPTL